MSWKVEPSLINVPGETRDNRPTIPRRASGKPLRIWNRCRRLVRRIAAAARINSFDSVVVSRTRRHVLVSERQCVIGAVLIGVVLSPPDELPRNTL